MTFDERIINSVNMHIVDRDKARANGNRSLDSYHDGAIIGIMQALIALDKIELYERVREIEKLS